MSCPLFASGPAFHHSGLGQPERKPVLARFYEARLLGLQGDILLLRGGANAENDAETAYLKSLEVARQQGAKAWELRTATSLTRLWGLQGRTREGVDLLASLYGSFGEGFDTPDLVDAKVLLEGLQ